MTRTQFHWHQQQVSWLEFNVHFQHKYGYIRDERSGVESYPLTHWRKASDMLASTLDAFLFSSQPKRERDGEPHLNYYASAYNGGRQLSHTDTNSIKCSLRPILSWSTDWSSKEGTWDNKSNQVINWITLITRWHDWLPSASMQLP